MSMPSRIDKLPLSVSYYTGIFYANIISINDSVFLVNDNVFKPLRALYHLLTWIWGLRHFSMMAWLDMLECSCSCSSLYIS